MAKAKRAKLVPESYDVQCPHCGESLAQPDSGSLFWTYSEIQQVAGQTVICFSCKGEVKMPRLK